MGTKIKVINVRNDFVEFEKQVNDFCRKNDSSATHDHVFLNKDGDIVFVAIIFQK
jgi:hypothetical protein